MLNNTFIAIDRTCINNILLNNLNEEACLGSHPSKDGMYTVKSGYHSIMEWKNRQKEESSNKEVEKEVWKKVWTSNVLPRKQFILWRLFFNLLPLKSNLSKRNIPTDYLGLRCKETIKTLDHCFMERWWLIGKMDSKMSGTCCVTS